MPFRAAESADAGMQNALRYLFHVPDNGLTPEEISKGEAYLHTLVRRIGPVVDSYPCWHPIVRHSIRSLKMLHRKYPSIENGYECLDHTVFFAHGFISCPYGDDAAETLIESVEKLPTGRDAYAPKARRLTLPMYAAGACPVLVYCPWPPESILADGTIAPKTAVTLMLQSLLKLQKHFKQAWSWEDWLPYLLGEPHGQRSSLFVNQETGMAMKKVYQSLVQARFFEA